MQALFDDEGRVVRDRWIRIDEDAGLGSGRLRSEPGSNLTAFAHLTDVDIQLADQHRITPLTLVDAAWYEPRGGRMAVATSFLWPVPDSGSEAHLLHRLRMAIRHGRLLPAPRWNLHLPSHAHGPSDAPRPPSLQLPVLQLPDTSRRPARPLMTPASLRTMEWLHVDTGPISALVLLRPFDIHVLQRESFEPALIIDVAVSDHLRRPLLPVRVIGSGPNTKLLSDLHSFLGQLSGLLSIGPGRDEGGAAMLA
jgi:hypothetical protein